VKLHFFLCFHLFHVKYGAFLPDFFVFFGDSSFLLLFSPIPGYSDAGIPPFHDPKRMEGQATWRRGRSKELTDLCRACLG